VATNAAHSLTVCGCNSVVIQPAVPTSLFKILEVFLPVCYGGFYELEQCWVRNPFPLHSFLPSESAKVLLRNHIKRSAVRKTLMPGTVTERRTWLSLKMCGFWNCRVNECEDYRLPERHSMQSLGNIQIFRRKRLLHVQNTGSWMWRRQGLPKRQYSAKAFLSRPHPPHYTTNEKDVTVQLITMSHGCMGELWPVLPWGKSHVPGEEPAPSVCKI